MPKGQAGAGAAEKTKKTEKEKKKEKKAEIERIVNEIRALIRQEQSADPSSPEWTEFESALTGFLNGDINGNVNILSVRIYDNIQSFAKGKKNFIESAKGQETARKLLEEMRKVPGAEENEHVAPLFTFLTHMANGDLKKVTKEKLERAIRPVFTEKVGTVTVFTEEGEKKEKAEAEEALKEFHKKMGLPDPKEMRKAQRGV